MFKNKIAHFILLIILILLIAFEKTRKYGIICIALIFLVVSLIALINRIIFDISLKDKVIGEIIDNKEECSEDGYSYYPICKYKYQTKEEIYTSPVKSFTFKKSKKIGDKVVLSISRHNPKHVRIDKISYTIIEYLGIILVLVMGILLIVFRNKI